MIPVTTCAGQRLAVVGLGLSGLSAARALVAGGAEVVCWDDGEVGREKAGAEGFEVVDLKAAGDDVWAGFSAMVLAPGIPLTHPEPHWSVQRAQAAGVEVIGDTELFFRERALSGKGTKVIAITGTNGKSTTTALTAHLLKTAGKDVVIGGNIGEAILDQSPFKKRRIYVIEFSSYQLDLTPSVHANAAALLNITPDHLDRHGTIENYAAVKTKIFDNMEDGDTAVINVDDPRCIQIAARFANTSGAVQVSTHNVLDFGVTAIDGELMECGWGEYHHRVTLKANDSLRGVHNWQNGAVAWSLARCMRCDLDKLVEGIATFPGLEHRMEIVGRVGKVLVVNDSKGTNADATRFALDAFDGDIFWIAGGLAKDGGVADLADKFDKVSKAYLIGQSAPEFAEQIGDRKAHVVGALDAAVEAALADAEASAADHPVVLLSPAAASFDQFRSFEVRGDAFKADVMRVAAGRLVPHGEAA